MSDLSLILTAAAATYLLRVGLIAIFRGRELPVGFHRLVAQIRPAAFTALAVTGVARSPEFGLPHLVAILVVALGTRLRLGLLISVAAGMASLLVLSAIL